MQSARELARSRWFVAGWGLAAVAWLIHVASLSMAPISLVQGIVAGGAVTLAVMSQRLFGSRVERRQWLALFLGGAGLALLAVTVPQFSGNHSQFDWAPILGFEGGLALIAAGLALGHRSERLHPHRGILLAVLAGTLFALAGVAIKGLTGAAGLGVPIIAGWVAIIVLCGVLAQYTAVSALQRGGAIETIGLMGLVANATQIAAGVLVFGDPLSSDPLGVVLQILGLPDGLRLGAAAPGREPGGPTRPSADRLLRGGSASQNPPGPSDDLVPPAADPIRDGIDPATQRRRPEEDRRGGAEGGAGEHVARVVDPSRNPPDREHRGERDRDDSPAGLAQEDRHRDRERGRRVVAGKARVRGVGDEEVQPARVGDERPRAIDQAPDHSGEGEGETRAPDCGDGGPAPIAPLGAMRHEENHPEGRREQHLGAVDVEDERVLDGIVLAQEVVEGMEDRPFHPCRFFTSVLREPKERMAPTHPPTISAGTCESFSASVSIDWASLRVSAEVRLV